VIDDGSHISSHIVQCFARYFPLVSEGGIFIAEDLHCSYWGEFEGGLSDPLSSVSFFKLLADVVNKEHWGVPFESRGILRDFERVYGCTFDEQALEAVHSVEFLNSLCVVRKKSKADNVLGPRVIVGRIEQVSSNALEYAGSFSKTPDQSENFWSNPVHILSAQELSLEKEVRFALQRRADRLEAQLALLGSTAAVTEGMLRARIGGLSSQLESEQRSARELLAAKDAQLAELMLFQNTHAARLARLMARMLKRAFPASSIRRRALERALRTSEGIYRYGLLNLARRRLRGEPSGLVPTPPTTGSTVQLMASALPPDYQNWIAAHEPDAGELARQSRASPAFDPAAPLFSLILPVYKVPAGVLRATIASVQQQSWKNWELCIAFADDADTENFRMLQEFAARDPRLKLEALTENGGISRNSNAALRLASGEFIALLDHDDELTPWALHDMATAIAAHPEADFLYSDKDSINADGTVRMNPLFKPEWSPEILYSVNYLTHLNVMRRAVVESIGGWRPETDGAQDWDLFIRVSESARAVRRVVGVGYHWRIIEGSTSTGLAAKPYAALAQLRTVEDWVNRQGLQASVVPHLESGFRVIWTLPAAPTVDLILYGEESGDRIALLVEALARELGPALASISVLTRQPLGSETFATVPVPLQEYEYHDPAQLAAAFASAAAAQSAPVLTILDASVVTWAPGSLREISAWAAMHPEIAFAAPLLLDSTDRVVEGGRVLGSGLRTQALFKGSPLRHWGAFGGPLWYRNVSASAATAVAVKRTVWEAGASLASGRAWPEAWTAICSASRETGLRGMVTPHARFFPRQQPGGESTAFDPSFAEDPYFHPAFSSVHPLVFRGPR
jgi:hypothetical protein